jgi:N6-adenosine-specific RNA methylase IME4/ParB-like chromosome segregation protein Spo0J
MTLEFHALATLFPLLNGEDFDELVADIRTQGLREPIVMFEGKVLDGRNRYRACVEAGVEPTLTVYQGDDPVAYVISLNLRRRHLDESQRAMVAAKLATLKLGDNQHSKGLPIGRSSELLKVGERTVARAREVQEHGAPELVHAVEQGRLSVSAAADIAGLAVDKQREIVARGEREILQAAMQIRSKKAVARRAKRNASLLKLSNINCPLPDRRFPIILADPPYQYDRRWAVSREIENHYPTMTAEAICALSIVNLATPDAMLFLWAPAPLLTDALNIMTAWGFEYATSAVWVKDRLGMGVYVRQQHELLLIGKRGLGIVPHPSTLSSSVIAAPRREHSRKPDEVYDLIERMYPELPKIELFARTVRPGWDAWGNEVGTETAPGDGIPDFLRRRCSKCGARSPSLDGNQI